MPHTVLVLRTNDRTTLDDVVHPFNAALQQLKTSTGMFFVIEQALPADPDVDICTWTDERLGHGQISLVENRHLRVVYAQLSLSTTEEGEVASATIANHVPICSIGELQRAAEAAAATDGRALATLGLASPPEFDPTTASLVTSGLASPNPDVREGAVYAAFLLKWPAFQQPVAKALEREDREDLRRMLEAAATVCDPAWPGFDVDSGTSGPDE